MTEALAITAAGAAVLAAVVLGGSGQSTQIDPAVAARDGFSSVVLVDSGDAAAAGASWKTVPSAALPGQVLVASTDSGCEQMVSARAKADQAVQRQAVCAGADSDSAQRLSALGPAAAEARAAGAELVLLGEGWTAAAPLPGVDANNPESLGLAVLGARAAGQLPDLSGLTVVVVGRPASPEIAAVWDAYLAAAGASEVQWIAR